MFSFFRNNKLMGASYEEQGAPVNGRSSGTVGWGFYVLVAGAVWAVVELFLSVIYFF